MFGAIGSFLVSKTGFTILAIVAPIALGLINVSKYGSIIDNFMFGLGVSLSLVFQTKFGNALEKIAEWFIIKLIVILIIFPVLSFIRGMRKDDKQTLEMHIEAIRGSFKKMLQVNFKKLK